LHLSNKERGWSVSVMVQRRYPVFCRRHGSCPKSRWTRCSHPVTPHLIVREGHPASSISAKRPALATPIAGFQGDRGPVHGHPAVIHSHSACLVARPKSPSFRPLWNTVSPIVLCKPNAAPLNVDLWHKAEVQRVSPERPLTGAYRRIADLRLELSEGRFMTQLGHSGSYFRTGR
jgi:hypothetical protein